MPLTVKCKRYCKN